MTATYRVRTTVQPERSKFAKMAGRIVEMAATYALTGWMTMVILGALHSWQPRIPAIPFWPVVELLYLIASTLGFAVWVVIRVAQIHLEDR